jgi:hypothetical protein
MLDVRPGQPGIDERLPTRSRSRTPIVQVVFGALVLTLPSGHPRRVAVAGRPAPPARAPAPTRPARFFFVGAGPMLGQRAGRVLRRHQQQSDYPSGLSVPTGHSQTGCRGRRPASHLHGTARGAADRLRRDPATSAICAYAAMALQRVGRGLRTRSRDLHRRGILSRTGFARPVPRRSP